MTKVLVTGASGYVAKYIILQLLQAGYDVCGSVRSLSRDQEIADAVKPHLDPEFDLKKHLSFIALDLTADDGWTVAMDGIDGTLRALRAVAEVGIKRVVLTSSTASVIYCALPDGEAAFDESHWTDINHPTCAPYAKSKTLAEQAAWDFVENHTPDIQMTTINPGFVIGAPLDSNFGISMKTFVRLLSGKNPALPQVGFTSVDARDVAAAHVGITDNLDSHGLRISVVERFMWFADIAHAVADTFPDRKIVTQLAPNWLIRLLGLFD